MHSLNLYTFNEKQLVSGLDVIVFMQVFLFFFLNHFSDLRSLMQFMNLQKKNVNGNQMKMKFRLVPTLVCFYTLEIFYYKIDGELTTIRTDEPLLTLASSVPKFVFPLHFFSI